jgi:hypothetical protein
MRVSKTDESTPTSAPESLLLEPSLLELHAATSVAMTTDEPSDRNRTMHRDVDRGSSQVYDRLAVQGRSYCAARATSVAAFAAFATITIAIAACGSAPDHAPPAGGAIASVPPQDPSTASSCPAGDRRDCTYTIGTHDGVTDCTVGSQLCLDGGWGDCGDATAFCTGDTANANVTFVAAGSSAFATEWNASSASLSIGIDGLRSKGKEHFKLVGGGSASLSGNGSAPPIELDLSTEPRELVLFGETTVTGASLRMHAPKVSIEIPVQTLDVTVHLDNTCTLQEVDVSLFVDASTTTPEQSAMLGTPTDTSGTAVGWWIALTGTPQTHGH